MAPGFVSTSSTTTSQGSKWSKYSRVVVWTTLCCDDVPMTLFVLVEDGRFFPSTDWAMPVFLMVV